MRRFVLPPDCTGEGLYTLTGKPFHHICRVRRSKAGARLDAVDGQGRHFLVVFRDIGPRSCRVELVAGDVRPAEEAGPRIVLFQGLPKGRKLDQIIRQCTEAGVAEIVPFTSRNTVAESITGARAEAKLGRWTSIAREAVQQSGRPTVPIIRAPIDFSEIPAVGGIDELGLVFHQDPLEYESLHGYLKSSPSKIAVVIGGEGGFTPSEVDIMVRDRGYRLGYLGPTVLRTETAAIYVVAAVQTILREIEAWNKK